MRRYTVLLIPEPEEGGYSVTVPALPGCYTQGESWDEALANAQDAIRLYLEDVAASGEPLPEDVAPPSWQRWTYEVGSRGPAVTL